MKLIFMIKTIVTKVNKNSIKKAARILRKGGLVIYPTETCYGLGANATNVKAIRKVYKVKKRPYSKPIHIIVSSLKMMESYGEITKEIRFLVKKFMPGPLNIVTKKKKNIPKILNTKDIAFRIPKHSVALRLVKETKLPITATSANVSGQPPLYKIRDVLENFKNKVEMILDCGNLKRVKPSTFIDMKSKPRILREGSIKGRIILKELEKFKAK
ncbi:MAG: threonylcarbamoyl-AMP synthase [Candidatus Aenigmarchaeota archaeon]|nr:threonylcarbamoyl-AMP synthase [Candidatus Aenigmarchaeota archaeon]